MKPLDAKNRYARQYLLSEIGTEGQEKLQSKKVALVGIGALGTVAAELLIRAGVENFLVIDRDVIEESNLQRQILFSEKDVGKSKALAAQERLKQINSKSKIQAYAVDLDQSTISLLENAEIILDCSDNMQTRLLINDFCRQKRLPWIYAAAIKTSGYVMPIVPEGPCLRCFMAEARLETCETAGVLNTATTIIAGMQATLAIKMIMGIKVKPELRHYNAWRGEHTSLRINKKNDCPTCQENYEYLQKKEAVKVVPFCSSGRYQIKGSNVNFKEIKNRWNKIGKVIEDKNTLEFKNILLFEDGRALIKAASAKEALTAYSKYVGN